MIGMLDRKLLRDLVKLRAQLFAIAAVVASGIATLVTMRSTLDSLQLAMTDAYATQRFADVFVHLERAPQHVEDELARVPGVAALDTRVVADVKIQVDQALARSELRRGAARDGLITGRFVSLPDDDRPHLVELHVLRGRLPEPGRVDEVALSDAFAHAHGLLPGDSLSVVVNERQLALRVVGEVLSPEYVYAMAPGSIVPDDELFGVLFARRALVAASFGMEGAFNDVVFTLARGAEPRGVLAAVDRILAPYGGLGAIPRADQASHWFVANELKQLQSMGRMLPSIFLGVATFLFAVVLARMVTQQRGEIAVMKAFGRRDLELGLHYGKLVVLVAVVAALGGLVAGRAMGSAMVDLYRPYFRFPRLAHVVEPSLALAAVGVALGAALLGAAAAVRRAVRMAPAEAMRPPAPPTFQRALFERVGAFWSRGPAQRPLVLANLSVTTRSVLRNIERKPLRALASVFGTASGGALLLSGLAMSDSIDNTLALQFTSAQREDMTATLGTPRGAEAIDEFTRLPGVRRAEPFRVVDTRFRAGTRQRRVALEGVSPGATLRPPIDSEGRVRAVPASGLALSEGLAEALGVGVGEHVVVESLEERRPVFTAEVTAVYSSFVGLGARMDADELARALGEGPRVSGVHLLVDPAQRRELDEALREAPLVVGASARADTLRRFRETTAESMGFMAFFLVLFATVLVAGVVYNDARVTLAERGRELASMRVLGYRRGEVATIFLGETWLLAALGIPVGCGLGAGLAWFTLRRAQSEMFHMPLAIEASTYAITALVLIAAAVASGLLCRRGLDRIDLVEVLKERS
jgi:putative ABC transport system permease protein